MEVCGYLNRKEASFLLQFAINTLMMQGVVFDLTKESEELRIAVPEGTTMQ